MRRSLLAATLVAPLTLCLACSKRLPPAADADEAGFTAPAPHTREALAKAAREVPEGDDLDRADAERGLVASAEPFVLRGEDGRVIFDAQAYAFVTGDAPDSVHPSLWRHERLNGSPALYRVTDGVYQVRGFDLAVMTILEGETGLVVVDPLMTRETSARALAFARKHLGEKPVRAVIFTHSHVDHFGGVLGVIDPNDVRSGAVRVIAPKGFLEEATSENVLAGPTMGRRAVYMYGRNLPRSPRGKVGNGLGKEPASGAMGIVRPTELVDHTPQELTIDGLAFAFQFTPASEAPAEMTFYLPAKRAFCASEIAARTLHNIYTIRGAKVRDADRWAGYLDDAAAFAARSDVLFFSHNWPVFGAERIQQMLEETRDTYRYIHDQAVHLANQGYGPREIAERLTLPASLRKHGWNRGYYGTVKHDAKGVYQHYFGWYDANPASLDPLPRAESAKRTVRLMGGAAKVVAEAQRAFDEGEYRWVAELLAHVVAAEPDDAAAKALLARTFDQLGYASESTAWRNAYLTGAAELRSGPAKSGGILADAADLLNETPPEQFLRMFQVALDGPKADGVSLRLNIDFREPGEQFVLDVSNAVLHYRRGEADPKATATLAISRAMLVRIVAKKATIPEVLGSPEVTVTGSKLDVARFFALLDPPDPSFPIVIPKP
jgi:alkyl sulfatase BDS1-like metallo-beta-lactamase superfamily hydrolase